MIRHVVSRVGWMVSAVLAAAACSSSPVKVNVPGTPEVGSALVIVDAPTSPLPKGTQVEIYRADASRIEEVSENGQIAFDNLASGYWWLHVETSGIFAVAPGQGNPTLLEIPGGGQASVRVRIVVDRIYE